MTRLRRGRTENVKLFPASLAQIIIWILPESLRSPSPSAFSLLKVPTTAATATATAPATAIAAAATTAAATTTAV